MKRMNIALGLPVIAVHGMVPRHGSYWYQCTDGFAVLSFIPILDMAEKLDTLVDHWGTAMHIDW